jgi:acyl-CoA thioester hydrolase
MVNPSAMDTSQTASETLDMPRFFTHRLIVPDSAIDGSGHVNNIEYVRWMQDAAVAHSEARGWTEERYRGIGCVWVVREHRIEYLRPAFAGQQIRVLTWVADLKRQRSTRKYRILREEDGALLARAETLWVFIDHASGRPCPLPPEMQAAFHIVSAEEEPT